MQRSTEDRSKGRPYFDAGECMWYKLPKSLLDPDYVKVIVSNCINWSTLNKMAEIHEFQAVKTETDFHGPRPDICPTPPVSPRPTDVTLHPWDIRVSWSQWTRDLLQFCLQFNQLAVTGSRVLQSHLKGSRNTHQDVESRHLHRQSTKASPSLQSSHRSKWLGILLWPVPEGSRRQDSWRNCSR